MARKLNPPLPITIPFFLVEAIELMVHLLHEHKIEKTSALPIRKRISKLCNSAKFGHIVG